MLLHDRRPARNPVRAVGARIPREADQNLARIFQGNRTVLWGVNHHFRLSSFSETRLSY